MELPWQKLPDEAGRGADLLIPNNEEGPGHKTGPSLILFTQGIAALGVGIGTRITALGGVWDFVRTTQMRVRGRRVWQHERSSVLSRATSTQIGHQLRNKTKAKGRAARPFPRF